MSRRWWEDVPIEELEARVRALRGEGFKAYRPESGIPGTHGGIYHEFLREFEEEGDEEKVLEKYVRKLLVRGGWKKEEARKRLMQALARERQSGGLG